jgi:glycosyltransferase involved in cell wall biosynthesis
MNILLINHYAGSVEHGMEFRPFYMAREWVKRGHKVRIVAASHSHVRNRQPATDQIDTIQLINGIEYQWLRTPVYDGNSAARAVNIFTFAAKLLAQASYLATEFRPDVVIASSTHPFDIYGAARIARRAKARLIFEIHDLWPLSPIELGGMSPYHPFILAVGTAEKRALAVADTVVSILPATKSYLVGRGMAPDKFVHVPNGIDVAEWNESAPLPEAHAKTLDELRARGKFLVGYAGAHGIANGLGSLIETARLSRNDRIQFVLVGHGPEKSNLTAMVDRLGLKNVTFLDSVPKKSVPALLEKFDTLYFTLQRQPLFRFGISPNKLMDYMMAAKPIVQAVSAGNDLIAGAGCGISIAPEEPEILWGAIQQLMQIDRDTTTRMGERGRAYVLAHHDYRVLAERFLTAAGGSSSSTDGNRR